MDSIEALRSRSPGDDPEDPYADVDVSSLPAWWRRAIEEFEAHDLRPYRPPRFADGTLAYEVIGPLEAEFGVDIDFASVETDFREAWSVRVDGEPVGAVGRRRSPEGYTVYETDPDDFEALVRAALDDG
jgi:hypothetical protein